MRVIVCITGIALALSSGCARDAAPIAKTSAPLSAPPTATGGGPRAGEYELAAAFCAQAKRCGAAVGAVGTFGSRDDCVAWLVANELEGMPAHTCVAGPSDRTFDGRSVRRCIEAVSTQRCDDETTPSACLAEALCPE